LNYLKLLTKTIAKKSVFLIALLIAFQNVSAQTQQTDSNYVKIDTSKFVMQKSPWGAVLRSAVLPGLGQFYNQSYWKIPVIWGVFGLCINAWISTNNSYKTNRDLYSESVATGKDENIQAMYLKLRNFYRDERDLNAVLMGLTYLLTLVDAYVDAQLFDFDINKFNSVNTYNISVKIKF
jgi:hypothetical protein